MLRVVLGVALLALAGCELLRENPLDGKRGAIVLVLDTRKLDDLKELREKLSDYDARATVFAGGAFEAVALQFKDFEYEGHEIGLAGLRGLDPEAYSTVNGPQKYFQDEIVPQVLASRQNDLNPRYYLLRPSYRAKSEASSLPAFLLSRGFTRVIRRLPVTEPPRARPASELASPVLDAYTLTNALDRAQVAALAQRNEVLVIAPEGELLDGILREARIQGVPFATVGDLSADKGRW